MSGFEEAYSFTFIRRGLEYNIPILLQDPEPEIAHHQF